MENENRERRNILQDLNQPIPMNKTNTKNSLNPSSSRNKKPDSFSKLANYSPSSSAVAPKAPPRKLFLQKSKKNQPPLLSELKSGKGFTKPISKRGRKYKPSGPEENTLHNSKKWSTELQAKIKNSQETGSDDKKIAMLEDSFLGTVDGHGAPSVKTPPVEASVSPDIQCPSNCKMTLPQSKETPVCYAAGHLVSGVTDKRKCRRRGSLKGGCEMVNLFQDECCEINDSEDYSIPLLAEGSVRWHEDQGSDSRNRLDQCGTANVNASVVLDLPSTPSTFCGNATDLVWDDSISCSVSFGIGNVVNEKKTPIIVHSPGELQEFSGPWNNEMDGSLLSTSPISYSCGKAIVEADSEFSLGSLSSGNVIQTPNSSSGSEFCAGWPKVEVDQRNLFQSQNDLISEILSEENIDDVASWISDFTLENLSLSPTRISWRDGIFGSRNLEVEEFDCCRCLSDEEIDCDQQLITSPPPKFVEDKENDLGVKSDIRRPYSRIVPGENEETNMYNDSDLSPPLVLEYEPCISARDREKLPPHKPNTCAESICTSGGGHLVMSSESDWSCVHDSTCLRSDCYK